MQTIAQVGWMVEKQRHSN